MILDSKIGQQIDELYANADELIESGQEVKAIEVLIQALDLLPKPVEDWEASTWILTSLGETLYFQNRFEEALETLKHAMHCPNAIGNPLIHLRLGQVQFELGNFERAADELGRAYMSEGEEIFEDEDPKFILFVKEMMKL